MLQERLVQQGRKGRKDRGNIGTVIDDRIICAGGEHGPKCVQSIQEVMEVEHDYNAMGIETVEFGVVSTFSKYY
jgi:hypothetical protein